MHFEDLQLPSALIADLYKHSLVALNDVRSEKKAAVHVDPPVIEKPQEPSGTAEVAAVKPTEIRYLGGFGKRVSIILTDHFNPFIGEEDLEFLSKLLAACKLSLNDVAIINTASEPRCATLWDSMPADVMIMFDVDPSSVGLPFRRPHFEVQQWANAMFLTAPSIEALRAPDGPEVKAMKTRLWNCLKQIFLS